ncbi:MAG: thioredoxin family protein [Chthoniobacterales bacterium]
MKTRFSFRFTALVACLAIAITFLTASQSMAKPGWLTDYAAAVAQSKKENRPILIDFTGSDWCPWCVKMDKDVFSQAAFKTFAKSNLVLFEADFPRGGSQSAAVKKQNAELQAKFGVEGFPTTILVGVDGKEIARNGGYVPGGPSAFINWVQTSTKK